MFGWLDGLSWSSQQPCQCQKCVSMNKQRKKRFWALSRRLSVSDFRTFVILCPCVDAAAMNWATSLLFSFREPLASVCVCVCVGVKKKHIMFSSPGNHDQPNSLRSSVMQLFLCSLPHHVPPAVHQTWLMVGRLQHNICSRQPSKCTSLLLVVSLYLYFSLCQRCRHVALYSFLFFCDKFAH